MKGAKMKIALRGAVALCCAFVLVACGEESGGGNESGGAPAAPEANIVDVELTEYAFGMTGDITGGTITFQVANKGEIPHEVAFGAIEGDRTTEDIEKALQGGRPPKWFKDIAGIPVLSPGVTASMTRELDPGQYVFLCFLPTPGKGHPHAFEGMWRLFEVDGSSGVAPPEPDLTITASEDGFDVPDISAGTHTIELVNDGTKAHEFAFVSYEPGKTEKDLDKWFGSGLQGPAPALFPGGMQSVPSGESVVVEMTFEAGRTYRLEDFESKLSSEFTPQ
jgi:hypothetical protein